jgi:hypothetical protein
MSEEMGHSEKLRGEIARHRRDEIITSQNRRISRTTQFSAKTLITPYTPRRNRS